MKKVLIVLTVLFLISCNSFNTNSKAENPNSNIALDLPKGIWKISYFFKDSADKTHTYSGFDFKFDGNGTVMVTKDSFKESGTWVYKTVSGNTSDENNEELILQFSDTGFFKELSDKWYITLVSSTKTELFNQNNVDNHMQFLTFSKE